MVVNTLSAVFIGLSSGFGVFFVAERFRLLILGVKESKIVRGPSDLTELNPFKMV